MAQPLLIRQLRREWDHLKGATDKELIPKRMGGTQGKPRDDMLIQELGPDVTIHSRTQWAVTATQKEGELCRAGALNGAAKQGHFCLLPPSDLLLDSLLTEPSSCAQELPDHAVRRQEVKPSRGQTDALTDPHLLSLYSPAPPVH
jgi:hypothetical protein